MGAFCQDASEATEEAASKPSAASKRMERGERAWSLHERALYVAVSLSAAALEVSVGFGCLIGVNG